MPRCMPTLAFRLQGDGYWQGWTSFTGATFAHECLDDSTDTTHDSATSYVTLGRLLLNPQAGRISFPIMLMAEGLVPSSLTLNVAAMEGGVNNPDLQIGFARSGLVGFHATVFSPTASWSVVTRTFSTNPITGSAWDADDLIGLEACVQSFTGQTGNNDITLISGSIAYHPRTNWGRKKQRMS
jgi:hypothetical protein